MLCAQSSDGTSNTDNSGVAVPPGFWHRLPPAAGHPPLSSSPGGTRLRPSVPPGPDHDPAAPPVLRVDPEPAVTIPLLQGAHHPPSALPLAPYPRLFEASP